MATSDECDAVTYPTPITPENPYPSEGGGGGGGGGGGSCDCDPTSGSYPTTTSLSTDINGNTVVALSSVSGLASSKVVIGETLIYDGAGTVARVIAKSGTNLTVQTMTIAGSGGGGSGESSGSYLTSTELTTAITGTTNVPQSSVTGLNPADVVIFETLIFDDSGTVGRIIGKSGTNYVVQTMTIAPGERAGARLGAVNTQGQLPSTCVAATALGWQTPISGDYAYVRDYNDNLAEFVATVDDDCNITWAFSHYINAGDYITGVRDQDGNLLTIAADGTVTLPRESDGTYKTTTSLNKAIDGTRVITLGSTNITSLGLIVLDETLVYDPSGTVGKITAVSGNNLTVRTITTAGSGDESDGSYPTSSVLTPSIGVATDIAIASVSGFDPNELVINETLIYDEVGTVGRVVAINNVTNELTVETMTTSGDPNLKSDGTYHTTSTINRTIGYTNTIALSATSISDDTKIALGETLLYDDAGTMAVVTNYSSPNLTAVTITTAGSSDGTYKLTSGTLATTIDTTGSVNISNTTIPSASKVVKGETLLYDAKGTMAVVTNVSGSTLTVKTISTSGLTDGTYLSSDLLANKVTDTVVIPAANIAGITVADIVIGETLVNDKYGRVGKVTAVSGTDITVETITIGVGATTAGIVGAWFYADNPSGGYSGGSGTVEGKSNFWMLESNALKDHYGTLHTAMMDVDTNVATSTAQGKDVTVVELPGPALYEITAVSSTHHGGTDAQSKIFVKDTTGWHFVGVPARATGGGNENEKRNQGVIQYILEVPEGEIKYLGYCMTRNGGSEYLGECSFMVKAINGTKFLGNTTISHKIEIKTKPTGTFVNLVGDGSSNLVNENKYTFDSDNPYIVGDASMLASDKSYIEIPVSGFYDLYARMESSSNYTSVNGFCVSIFDPTTGIEYARNANYMSYNSAKSNGAVTFGEVKATRYLEKGTRLMTGAYISPSNYNWGNNTLSVALISGDSVAELMMKPNLWTPNTEIDFGDGLYGFRSTGNNWAADVQNHTYTAHGQSYAQTKYLGVDGVTHIQSCGGCIKKDGNYRRIVPFGSGLYHVLGGNQTSEGNHPYINDYGELCLASCTGNEVYNPAGTTNVPYDVWVLYTKGSW